ncbi:kinase interacting family protein [Striga hermonthica]|uniref:Kinase interacting family protein n=1 Tax=Striga hermonthica TaxID=68872 RepID=A0A9N7RJ35_STRHE|nr:kinase interacting family protein [Striga hermonthica]
METPLEGFICRKKRLKESPSTPFTSPNTAISSSLLKQVFLHDWWLVEADSGFDGKRLGVGGLTSKESRGIRSFCSAPIVTRHDAVTLKTVDGITVLLHGHLNMSRSVENGFSRELCENFQIGFPYYWEEYAAISNGEDLNPGGNRTSNSCGNIFDEILKNKCDDAFGCGEGSNVDLTPDQTLSGREKVNPKQKMGSHPDKNSYFRNGLMQVLTLCRKRRGNFSTCFILSLCYC